MPTRVLAVAVPVSVLVCAVIIWVAGRGTQSNGSSGVERRLQDLESSLSARLDAVEKRLAASSGSPLKSTLVDAEDPEGVEAQERTDLDGAILARLERRIDDLELRLRATDADPVHRGYAYLQSSSPDLRRQGINLLRRIARTDPEALRALREMLGDADSGVREEAIESLAEVRDAASVPKLLTMLSDPDSDVREEVLDALDDVLEGGGDPAAIAGAIDFVLSSLSDADAGVRESAIETLGELRAREAVPQLVELLADTDEDIRERVIESLAEIGDPAAAPALRELYTQSEGRDARRLALALRDLGDNSGILHEAARLREVALNSPYANDRENAVEFIAENAAEPHRDILERALQDPDQEVREEAEEGLRRLDRGGGEREDSERARGRRGDGGR